ncbi:MAG TPA: zinc ribbon domain-containing protein [Longimicrobiaceae bacterium]|nr:zinc ribbon domain-containing protein [Longimicrobiaceae bacterium]
MPIFEYRCTSCSHVFEKLILRNSAPPECPECEGKDLEKLLSLSAVSSEHTRSSARRGVQQRNQAVRTELAHEEHKRFHDHDH